MSQSSPTSQISPTGTLTGDDISKMLDEAFAGRGRVPLNVLLQQFSQILPPDELARRLGPRAADVTIIGILERHNKTYAAEYTRNLDAHTEHRRSASGKNQPHAEQHGTESADDPHADTGLANAISNAKTHEEKVQYIADHFEHGGSTEDAAMALGASKKDAEKIAAKEAKIRAEYDRKFMQRQKEIEEEMRARGASEEAIKRQRKSYEADRDALIAQQMQASGDLAALGQRGAEVFVDGREKVRVDAGLAAAKDAADSKEFDLSKEKQISQEKKSETTASKTTDATTSADDFDSAAGKPGPVAPVADFKAKLASMKSTDPEPTPKVAHTLG